MNLANFFVIGLLQTKQNSWTGPIQKTKAHSVLPGIWEVERPDFEFEKTRKDQILDTYQSRVLNWFGASSEHNSEQI